MPSESEDFNYYLLLPDGTIAWEPTEEDFALWREEARDLWAEWSED